MCDEANALLPHIESVFYATFHPKRGPQILYQVPDNLISQSSNIQASTSANVSRTNLHSHHSRVYNDASPGAPPSLTTASPTQHTRLYDTHVNSTPLLKASLITSSPTLSPSINELAGVVSKMVESPSPVHRASDSSVSTLDMSSPSSPSSYRSRNALGSLRPISASTSPYKSSSPAGLQPLLNFSDVSRFVIPNQNMCGRLIICSTQKHRVIGFPVCLEAEKYERVHFRYNLCLVFERKADLSCYEPVVRKIARVLMACEEESSFLSDPKNGHQIYSILEQIYEDLNSYHETSIFIDQFNSIELKLFPFYPNPPEVYNWTVPLALINISKRVEPNWDLTVVKVCKYIDGINHVSRIAYLADCSVELTRQAISHLLYYQCIMIIDIFQFSNIYTVQKSLEWLADDPSVKGECGQYVTKPGFEPSDWPSLLFLYSRLKPGCTVLEWDEEHGVRAQGIDIRRFMTFGIIKGFVRRIHRWPIFMSEKTLESAISESPTSEPKLSVGRKRGKSLSNNAPPKPDRSRSPELKRERSQSQSQAPPPSTYIRSLRPLTEAEEYARSVREEKASTELPTALRRGSGVSRDVAESRRLVAADLKLKRQSSGNLSSIANGSYNTLIAKGTYPSVDMRRSSQFRPIQYRSTPTSDIGSHPQANSAAVTTSLNYPPDLERFLDGTHHTDEIATHYQVGWPKIERWLVALGGGQGNGEYGRIAIIYK